VQFYPLSRPFPPGTHVISYPPLAPSPFCVYPSNIPSPIRLEEDFFFERGFLRLLFFFFRSPLFSQRPSSAGPSQVGVCKRAMLCYLLFSVRANGLLHPQRVLRFNPVDPIVGRLSMPTNFRCCRFFSAPSLFVLAGGMINPFPYVRVAFLGGTMFRRPSDKPPGPRPAPTQA